MSRYHHLSPAYNGDDTDAQTQWLFDGPDARLAEYARYRLPDALLAKLARAYFQHADNDMDELLADSREEFLDDMRTRSEL